MNPIQIEKQCLKALASKIRTMKADIKQTQREGGCASGMQYDLHWLKYQYRHRHIAYCMARGREYKQIEQTVGPNHEPNMAVVDALRELLEIGCLQAKGISEGMDALMTKHEATKRRLTPGQCKFLESVSVERQGQEKAA